MRPRKTKRSFLMAILGVAFEYFDMMLVSLLASSIVQEFVGTTSPNLKLLYAFVGYATAFLFRPLGAFFFGCMGDLYGRKISLMSSIALMSVAMVALALIPSVQTLGIFSTILFLLCRIAQGLAVGGEYGTAMTYAFELNPKWRTASGACVVSSTHVGGLFASFLAGFYVDDFRMIFLFGGIIGCALLFLRSFMQEYHVVTAKNVSEIATASVQDKQAILKTLVVASMLVLVFYGSLIYLNELMHQELNIPRAQIFEGNSLLLGFWIVLPPLIGYLTDQFSLSYHKIMRFGAWGVFLSAPLLGLAILSASYSLILSAQILMHLFHMLFCLCTPRFFGDLFANLARNTAISTAYSISASITAGVAPLICYLSCALFHTNFAICIPFMFIAVANIFILKQEKIYATG